MIQRYTRAEMGSIWTQQHKYQKWLDVELAVCEAWNQLGKIPSSSLQKIKENACFSLERIEEIEKVVKHDVIAFLTSLSENAGEDSRYIHMGLTSYDVVDTAFSLLLKESLEKIRKDVLSLQHILKNEALRYKTTLMVGRTHGVHAEPITFGIKLLVWYEEIKRHLHRVENALKVISWGRISGAVGTYIHLDPRVEEYALNKLGLQAANVSTQILQRDRHAEVISALALLTSSLDKFATEIRHLQRTEVLELQEPFTSGQKGSSSMPHKKNPVRSERISGLARVIRSNLHVSLENIPLWHERDISHSSSERIIFPDTFILTDFLLFEIKDILTHWRVYPERMKKNLEWTQGLIFSQRILLALTQKGLSRDQAYQMVQKNSFKAQKENTHLKKILESDKEITQILSSEEIEQCFDFKSYLKNIDFIFNKVLSDES
ncbi:adenylosuccinate lyase [bacterium]|nr:adenylosuccinate lyase [bacterium]